MAVKVNSASRASKPPVQPSSPSAKGASGTAKPADPKSGSGAPASSTAAAPKPADKADKGDPALQAERLKDQYLKEPPPEQQQKEIEDFATVTQVQEGQTAKDQNGPQLSKGVSTQEGRPRDGDTGASPTQAPAGTEAESSASTASASGSTPSTSGQNGGSFSPGPTANDATGMSPSTPTSDSTSTSTPTSTSAPSSTSAPEAPTAAPVAPPPSAPTTTEPGATSAPSTPSPAATDAPVTPSGAADGDGGGGTPQDGGGAPGKADSSATSGAGASGTSGGTDEVDATDSGRGAAEVGETDAASDGGDGAQPVRDIGRVLGAIQGAARGATAAGDGGAHLRAAEGDGRADGTGIVATPDPGAASAPDGPREARPRREPDEPSAPSAGATDSPQPQSPAAPRTSKRTSPPSRAPKQPATGAARPRDVEDGGRTRRPGEIAGPRQLDPVDFSKMSEAQKYDYLQQFAVSQAGGRADAWKTGEGQLNFVGVRGMVNGKPVTNEGNKYNDTLFVCRIENGQKRVYEFNASLDGGIITDEARKKFGFDKAGYTGGAPHLANGFYNEAFVKGTVTTGANGLRQAGFLGVHIDANNDGVISRAERAGSNGLTVGAQWGFQFHPGGFDDTVGNESLGCQVIKANQWNQFESLLKEAPESQQAFSYTLGSSDRMPPQGQPFRNRTDNELFVNQSCPSNPGNHPAADRGLVFGDPDSTSELAGSDKDRDVKLDLPGQDGPGIIKVPYWFIRLFGK